MYKAVGLAVAVGLVLAQVLEWRIEENQPGYETFSHPRDMTPPFYGAFALSAIAAFVVPLACGRWVGPRPSGLWGMVGVSAMVAGIGSWAFVECELGRIARFAWEIWGAAAAGFALGALLGVGLAGRATRW